MSRKSQSLLYSKSSPGVPRRLPNRPVRRFSIKKKPIQRVGETNNFIIDYDDAESLILMYGKEAPTSHGVKLGFNEEETTAVIKHLKQAKLLFYQ